MMTEIKKSVLTLVAALIFFGGMHIMLLEYVLPESYADIKLIYIYIFFLILGSLSIAGVIAVKKHNKEQVLNALLAVTVLNFLASLAFLLPDLLNKTDYTIKFVYQFFGVFFPVLLVETLVFIRVVNGVEKKSEEN